MIKLACRWTKMYWKSGAENPEKQQYSCEGNDLVFANGT
jgi:hypothetical protein